jgi:hypothetical protein
MGGRRLFQSGPHHADSQNGGERALRREPVVGVPAAGMETERARATYRRYQKARRQKRVRQIPRCDEPQAGKRGCCDVAGDGDRLQQPGEASPVAQVAATEQRDGNDELWIAGTIKPQPWVPA